MNDIWKNKEGDSWSKYYRGCIFFLNLFYEHQEENIFFYRLIWDESTYNELILSDLWLLNCSFVQRDDNWVMNFYSVSFI